MSKIELYGFPQSTYVRVARMACHEKGVDYDLHPVPPHSEEVNAVHPLGKIPVMRHGDIELCESKAIAGYIDRTFDGPPLIPEAPLDAARVEQWVSMVNTAMDRLLIRDYLFHYIFPKGPNDTPDRAAIDALLDDVGKHVGVLDAAAEGGHLVGDSFTLADINTMPILFYINQMPEASEMIKRSKNLGDYYDRHAARESFKATVPPPPSN